MSHHRPVVDPVVLERKRIAMQATGSFFKDVGLSALFSIVAFVIILQSRQFMALWLIQIFWTWRVWAGTRKLKSVISDPSGRKH